MSNATSRTILSTKSNVASTMLPVLATMSNEISSFRQCLNKLKMFNNVSTLSKGRNLVRHCCQNRQHCWQKRLHCRSHIRHCRKDFTMNRFDIVAVFWQQSRMLLRPSTKSNIASTLLLVWTGLNAGSGLIYYATEARANKCRYSRNFVVA